MQNLENVDNAVSAHVVCYQEKSELLLLNDNKVFHEIEDKSGSFDFKLSFYPINHFHGGRLIVFQYADGENFFEAYFEHRDDDTFVLVLKSIHDKEETFTVRVSAMHINLKLLW